MKSLGGGVRPDPRRCLGGVVLGAFPAELACIFCSMWYHVSWVTLRFIGVVGSGPVLALGLLVLQWALSQFRCFCLDTITRRNCWRPGGGAVENGPTASLCAAERWGWRPGTSGTRQVCWTPFWSLSAISTQTCCFHSTSFQTYWRRARVCSVYNLLLCVFRSRVDGGVLSVSAALAALWSLRKRMRHTSALRDGLGQEAFLHLRFLKRSGTNISSVLQILLQYDKTLGTIM